MRKLMAGSITVGIPTAAAVVLGLLAGTLQVLNETVFALSATWHAYIAVLLVFFAGVGISPLVGAAFRSALHLPVWAGYVISAAMGALVLALATIPNVSSGVHAAIAAVLTILSALGFAPAAAPAYIPPAPAPVKAPARAKASAPAKATPRKGGRR